MEDKGNCILDGLDTKKEQQDVRQPMYFEIASTNTQCFYGIYWKLYI